MVQLVSLVLIHWIVIYPVESAIQLMNNYRDMSRIGGPLKVRQTECCPKMKHVWYQFRIVWLLGSWWTQKLTSGSVCFFITWPGMLLSGFKNARMQFLHWSHLLCFVANNYDTAVHHYNSTVAIQLWFRVNCRNNVAIFKMTLIPTPV